MSYQKTFGFQSLLDFEIPDKGWWADWKASSQTSELLGLKASELNPMPGMGTLCSSPHGGQNGTCPRKEAPLQSAVSHLWDTASCDWRRRILKNQKTGQGTLPRTWPWRRQTFGKHIEADKKISSFKKMLWNPVNNLVMPYLLYTQSFECQVCLKQGVLINNFQGPRKKQQNLQNEKCNYKYSIFCLKCSYESRLPD